MANLKAAGYLIVASAQNAYAATRWGGPPNALAPTDDGTDTNGASQNSLNAIAVLELCADILPTAAPAGGQVAHVEDLGRDRALIAMPTCPEVMLEGKSRSAPRLQDGWLHG